MPRSGFGGAATSIPAACRRSTTPFQLEASAKAPCTRTTVSGLVSVAVSDMRAPSLVGVDVDDGLGERFRSFLRKVVSDAALDRPVRIGAGELLYVGARFRVGRAVGVPLERDRRNGDDRALGEPLLQLVVRGLAVGQP